jgi:hypothetical protein
MCAFTVSGRKGMGITEDPTVLYFIGIREFRCMWGEKK